MSAQPRTTKQKERALGRNQTVRIKIRADEKRVGRKKSRDLEHKS